MQFDCMGRKTFSAVPPKLRAKPFSRFPDNARTRSERRCSGAEPSRPCPVPPLSAAAEALFHCVRTVPDTFNALPIVSQKFANVNFFHEAPPQFMTAGQFMHPGNLVTIVYHFYLFLDYYMLSLDLLLILHPAVDHLSAMHLLCP